MISKNEKHSGKNALGDKDFSLVNEYDFLTAPWINFEKSPLWDEVLPLAKEVKAKAKQIIIKPGDPADGIYLLRSGKIKVVGQTKNGLTRTILTMGEESVLGDISLFSDKPYLHHIETLTDCVFYYLTKEQVLEEIFTRHPALTVWLFRNLAAKADSASVQLQDTTFYKINTRVGRFIYLYALKYGQINQAGGTWIPMSHNELAISLGAHRVTVTNAIQHLKREGLVQTRPSRIIVNDMAALKAYLYTTLLKS